MGYLFLEGYTGVNCSVDINECAPNPCKNNGNCSDGVNEYKCSCADRYNGTNCEFDTVNDCSGNPCYNNGTCVDGVNHYNCTCLPGFGGTR